MTTKIAIEKLIAEIIEANGVLVLPDSFIAVKSESDAIELLTKLNTSKSYRRK